MTTFALRTFSRQHRKHQADKRRKTKRRIELLISVLLFRIDRINVVSIHKNILMRIVRLTL